MISTFKAEDFAGCTIQECLETEEYLEACIKDLKKIYQVDDMLYCMSHLSAIRLALIAKEK